MTGEEMERAIEFILQNQATLEERIEQVNQNLSERIEQMNRDLGERIAETSRIMQMHAENQTEFIKIVTTAISDLVTAQKRTDDRVDRLAATVERFISEGRDGRA